MDDPDISVSLVKIDSTTQGVKSAESEIANNDLVDGNLLGGSKECHMLWDSLRKQGQLFKVLDTLTAKTARLIGRVQNQTATEADSATVVELLLQLGIMFVDMETKEDGSKEKRFTFVTDVESTLTRQAFSASQSMTKAAPPQPVPPLHLSSVETGSDSDEDHADTFEPNEMTDDIVEDVPAEPPSYVCEWCKADQGTPVMLDLHLLQHCPVLTRYRDENLPCPSCGKSFRQLLRLQNHLFIEHGMETAEAVTIMHELNIKYSKQQKEDEKENEEGEALSAEESDNSTGSDATDAPPRVCIRCEVCRGKFKTRIALRSHLMEVHKFSRQKAASSVYASVRCAEVPSPTKADSHVPKKSPKQPGYLLACVKCTVSYKDRAQLVKHLKSAHFMSQNRAQKEANKKYKELNATFACDLCLKRYCNRYVFTRHLIESHQFSKNQARLKSAQMYPHDKKRRTTGATATPAARSRKLKELQLKSKDEDSDIEEGASEKQPRRSLRTARKRGRKGRTPKCISRKLAEEEAEEMSEDVQENHGNRESDDEVIPEKESSVSNSGGKTDGADEDFELEEKRAHFKKQTRKKARRSSGSISDDEDYVPSNSESEENVKKFKWGHSEKAKAKVEPTSAPPSESNVKDSEKPEENPDDDGSNRSEKLPKKRSGRGRRANVQGKHKCPHCDKSFLHLSYAKLHISTIHKEKPAYQCSTCQKPFYFKTTFLRHLNCHKNEEMGINFDCEVCGKRFLDKNALNSHKRTHSKDNPFKCEFCDKSFFHQSLLLRHRNMHTKETEYKCPHCDRVFYRKGGLTYHIASIHDKKRDHVCGQCGQGFPCKSALLAHEHSHSTARTFQCDICGTRVKTKGNLKEHMICVHTDKRAYKCEICQKTFNRSHRLTLHMMMHRDERPHKCHLCEKGFRTRTNLRVHIKWHQDQRDFQCEQCGKTFLIPGNLDRHMKTHRNGKSYRRKASRKTAPEAGLPSADQTQLTTHMEAQACTTVDNQFQTVQSLVSGEGFESDLPTLASIAQHLSTMNIPVFQATSSTTQATIPVSINRAENTCTLLPGSVMSGEASAALAAFSHAQQQLQGTGTDPPVVSQAVQGSYEHMELTM
ncbi:uncharacterized protein LOC110976663 [Acanthaster planci]|uniref:Uncharacterized protein LOC110976663 n=1 Tax=Acanthaster planci TaxID=133434 RepID=A0A8B7XY62_ACAPL|nr:uncharacterized protein LOC110976663 [Acanthaster planci]